MRMIHFMNEDKRDARVIIQSLSYTSDIKQGLPGRELIFKRYLSAGEGLTHSKIQQTFGEEYGQALVNGDPEIDFEFVGRSIGQTYTVYLSGAGEVMVAPPKIIELILDPEGKEKERREPKDVEANVNEELPVRWTGKKLPKAQAIAKYLFKRTIQISHVDGLTYDYLFAIAKQLADGNEMVLLGAGKNGKQPLIFQINASPYRGFLEGRVDGEKYMLLLHLSNMELKRPG